MFPWPARDPRPDLPWLAADELRGGDVLLMLGRGIAWVGGLPIPVSWLIHQLGGGSYSHAALVTREWGVARVWDHSTEWKLGPVPLDHALADHAYCHVYRFRKHGEALGSARYPREPVVAAMRSHRGDPYDIEGLVLAGMVAVFSRAPRGRARRAALRVVLTALVRALRARIEDFHADGRALVCTAVPGVAFGDADSRPAHDFALEVDLGASPRREDWDALLASGAPASGYDRKLRELLGLLRRAEPALGRQLEGYREALRANAAWVPVGSRALPVNFVFPADLEGSRTLAAVGRLAIPRAA